MELELDFGVSVNPKFIPEGKEGISPEGWERRFNQGLEDWDLRTREVLQFRNETKFMLSGDYESIKGFLKDVYGYIDFSCIYIWNARCVDLINTWKCLPRPDLEIWRLL